MRGHAGRCQHPGGLGEGERDHVLHGPGNVGGEHFGESGANGPARRQVMTCSAMGPTPELLDAGAGPQLQEHQSAYKNDHNLTPPDCTGGIRAETSARLSRVS